MINGNQDAIAIDANIELEKAPGDEPGLRNRVMTPERPAAVRRPVEYDRDFGKSRRRIDDDGDAAADHDGATTLHMASDEDVDQNMDSLDEIDRRILASIIMSVDVTEVFSPVRVNKLAGASLDLTNGSDFSLVEDRNRVWEFIKTSVPIVVIGSPVYVI